METLPHFRAAKKAGAELLNSRSERTRAAIPGPKIPGNGIPSPRFGPPNSRGKNSEERPADSERNFPPFRWPSAFLQSATKAPDKQLQRSELPDSRRHERSKTAVRDDSVQPNPRDSRSGKTSPNRAGLSNLAPRRALSQTRNFTSRRPGSSHSRTRRSKTANRAPCNAKKLLPPRAGGAKHFTAASSEHQTRASVALHDFAVDFLLVIVVVFPFVLVVLRDNQEP